jgi:hypothetical protein
MGAIGNNRAVRRGCSFLKRLLYHEIDGGARRSICLEMYFSRPESPFT